MQCRHLKSIRCKKLHNTNNLIMRCTQHIIIIIQVSRKKISLAPKCSKPAAAGLYNQARHYEVNYTKAVTTATQKAIHINTMLGSVNR